MEIIIMVTALILSPLYIYSILWWIPLIFIMGILMEIFSGEPFDKDSLAMLSPYIILKMTTENILIQRIVGIVFSLNSFALSYFTFSKDPDYLWATYLFMFLSVMMIWGVVFSLFTEKGNK